MTEANVVNDHVLLEHDAAKAFAELRKLAE
jgi:hypothetical protein